MTHTLIIGAGLSGLAAAQHLVDRGQKVVVLEARDRVGGRTWTRQVEGVPVNLGAAYVGPTQTAVRALAARLGIALEPVYDAGQRVLTLGDGRWHWTGLPRLAPHRLLDFLQAKTRLDRLAAQLDPEAPWAHPRAQALDARTAEAWLREAVASRTVRAALRSALHTVLTTDPTDVSLLHLAWYWRTAGGFDALTDTTGGAQQDRIVGGSQGLSIAMAASLDVRLDHPVQRVEQTADRVVVTTPTGRFEADHVICTTPPPLTAAIDWHPALPAARRDLLQRLSPSLATKVFAVYERPFWRDDGLSGQALTDGGPIQSTFDSSPPRGPGVLMGFIEGSHSARYWAMSPGERRTAVLAQLTDWFGPRAGSPVLLDDFEWGHEPWSRGCLAHMPCGVWTRYGPLLRAPVGRVHWASAETATVWAGYMEGALHSGRRAAAEVLRGGPLGQ